MSRHLLLAVLLFFLAGVAPAQGYYVVDAANGPGSHFTSLPAAVAAAPSGSHLFLRPGRYEPFRVAGKALHIRGSGQGVTSIYLDETAGRVEIDSVPPGAVFTLEELTITAASYFAPYPFSPSHALPAPFIHLKSGSFVLRALAFGLDIKIDFGLGPSMVSHGAGVLQVEGALLHACEVRIAISVDQRLSDPPGEALPAALAAIDSRILLEKCSLTGSSSYSRIALGGDRIHGAPGLLLVRSQADLIDLNATGGRGSDNGTGLPGTAYNPAGDGGPGMLLRGSSLALLDRGSLQGGDMAAWSTSPMSQPRFGLANGSGFHVEAGSGVRIRETTVQGGTAYSRPAPAWTGGGRFQSFLPPLNRPLLSWARAGMLPDRGKLIVSGAPGDLLVLLASSRPAWVPLGDLGLVGTLFLDFQVPDFSLVGPVRLSTAGRWEFPIQAPVAAGVLGPWYLQAIRIPEGDQSVGSNLVQLTLWP